MGYLSCNRKSAVLTAYSQSPATTTTKKLKLRIFHPQDLNTATSGFSPSAFLGRGSHGSVFLATLRSGRLLAAVKVPSASPPDDDDDHPTTPSSTNIDNEIDILSSLPRRSPHLVNLLGHTRSIPRLAVVELMPGGSLHDLLYHSPSPPPWPRRLRLALHIAESVAFLHSLHPPVIHRDIKPSNILIDAAGRARLSDFGLAVRLAAVADHPPPPAGTMGYIDPAYVTPAYLSPGCDVYSYGVLLLEIVTGRRAIDMDYSPPSLVEWAATLIKAGRSDELRDPRVEVAPPAEEEREVTALAGKCVGEAAEGRPSMVEVVVRLRSVCRRAGPPPPPPPWWRVRGGKYPSNERKVSDVAS